MTDYASTAKYRCFRCGVETMKGCHRCGNCCAAMSRERKTEEAKVGVLVGEFIARAIRG